MGVGYCIAGCSERRCLEIIIPEVEVYSADQLYNRTEAGRARNRKYNHSKKGKERKRRFLERKRNENKTHKT